MKEINDLLNSLDEKIHELKTAERFHGKCVVVYRNSNSELFYAVANGRYNKIAKEEESQYIVPLPAINLVRIMDRSEAVDYTKAHEFITDGAGKRFDAWAIDESHYVLMMIKHYENAKRNIENLINSKS